MLDFLIFLPGDLQLLQKLPGGGGINSLNPENIDIVHHRHLVNQLKVLKKIADVRKKQARQTPCPQTDRVNRISGMNSIGKLYL